MLLLYLSAISCVSLYFIWKLVTKSGNEPPALSGALPIVGHLHLAFGDTAYHVKLLKRISRQCIETGGVVKLYSGPYSFYIISDPVDCLTALNACPEKSIFYDFAKRWVGNGLLTANDQTWKPHRKLLNPMFTQQALNKFLGVFNTQARRLVTNFEDKLEKGPFEHEHYLLIWSLESACKTIMGVDIVQEESQNNDFVHAINGMLNIIARRIPKVWLHNEYMYRLSSLRKEEDEIIRILKKRSNEVLQKRKEIINEGIYCREETSNNFKPIIDHILMLATEKQVLTDTEVLDEVNTLIAAAYDTTGHTLSTTLMTLGAHKDVQDRVYKELEEIFGKSERDVEKDDLSKMVYTEAVIKETLRLYPIVPIFSKSSNTEIKLSKYTLQPGVIGVSVLGLCRHPVWGADADQFRPERWLDPASLPDNHNAYPVFGVGRRSCIGRIYAFMSMKTTLAHILRRYKITSHNDEPTFKMDVVLKAVTPLLVSLENRF